MTRGVALITGAARRIGRALAIAGARAGYDVAVHHRPGDDASETVTLVEAEGRRGLALAADLSGETAAAHLVAQASAALGPITLLVNNASVFRDDRADTRTAETWTDALAVNLTAPVALIQAFAAALPPNREGLAVNLIDQRVLRPSPPYFSYGVSKAGLWWATRTLAQALAPRIRVNAIGPGPTFANQHQPSAFGAEAAGTLLGRPIDPADIAAALTYLIDAKAVTGQMIAVDSGQHLGWRTPDVQEP